MTTPKNKLPTRVVSRNNAASVPWRHLGIALLCLASLIFTEGCTRDFANGPEVNAAIARAKNQHGDNGDATVTQKYPLDRENAFTPATPLDDPRTEVTLGSGNFTGASPNTPISRAASDGDGLVLNFQGADIQEVVKAILGEMLGANYIIEQGVSGTVTTETSGGLDRDDLLPVLEMLLRQSQAALIKDGDLYRIVPIATSLKGSISPSPKGRSEDPSYGMQIVTLRYIAVVEMQKILQPILNDGALIHADEKRNLMILAGSPSEQQRYLETISVFDVDWMKGMSTGIFKLKFVDAKDLQTELETALAGDNGKVLDGLVRLVALERLSALLAISPSRRALQEIQSWIARLDIPSDNAEPRLYVYRLQNAKAVEVAAILNDVFAEDQGSRLREVELAPGLRPVTVTSENPDSTPANNAVDSGSGVAVNIGENVRIIPDETNNALVIKATPREYENIAAAIEKLDLIPLQVLIEATIIEVTLTDDLEYGVEWFFKNGLGNDKQGQGLLDLGAPTIGTLAPAFSYAVVDAAGGVRAALNALATVSLVSILSSPSLMVLDNQTATINVGDEIPIPTRSSISNIDPNAPTVNEIEYRNTGVTLQVTPRVNAGGLVTMEVDQEVSDAIGTTSSDLNAPTIQQRKITSTVAIQSGDTIVLGGLIRDTATEGESGIPYLRNIPGVGKLFSSTTDNRRRTELIVLITPRAVDNGEEARALTQEYTERMRSFAPTQGFELEP